MSLGRLYVDLNHMLLVAINKLQAGYLTCLPVRIGSVHLNWLFSWHGLSF